MQKMIRFLSGIALLVTAVVAQAQIYLEASLAALSATESVQGIQYEAKPWTFSGFVGYQINPYLAVEGYLGLGAGHAITTENGINYGEKFKVDSSYGIFVKPRFAISNDMELFARLGYLQNKFSDSNIDRVSFKEAQSSVAIGVGANYYLDNRTYLTGSYMSYYKKDGLSVNGFSVGVGYKF
jgi:opacity protein-like surface antigen